MTSPPVLVRGNATEEEVAALLAVLSTASSGAATETPAVPGSRWAAPSRLLRVTFPQGPGGWAASAIPR